MVYWWIWFLVTLASLAILLVVMTNFVVLFPALSKMYGTKKPCVGRKKTSFQPHRTEVTCFLPASHVHQSVLQSSFTDHYFIDILLQTFVPVFCDHNSVIQAEMFIIENPSVFIVRCCIRCTFQIQEEKSSNKKRLSLLL